MPGDVDGKAVQNRGLLIDDAFKTQRREITPLLGPYRV
jgi:hypothetical protein